MPSGKFVTRQASRLAYQGTCVIQPAQTASERTRARITAQVSRESAGAGLLGLPSRLISAVMVRFSLCGCIEKFVALKTKNPLHSLAVSGLEIRFKGLLNDSDRTPAPAVCSTTTRRIETGVGATIHDWKSYLEWMRSQSESCKKMAPVPGERNRRQARRGCLLPFS